MKKIKLFDYQKKAIKELTPGSILWGGVGSGKSLTSLGYYYENICGGRFEPERKRMKTPKDLYIITTARKRDEHDWESEALHFGLHTDNTKNQSELHFIVDSWNRIEKYKDVKDSFFIFDEQKLVGYGAWVKAFLKIAKNNKWILLTATPGDIWMDYLPVFIANGFFKNKTEFTRKHVVFNSFTTFPKIERYIDTGKLETLRRSILVKMDYKKHTVNHMSIITVPFDEKTYTEVKAKLWNPYKNRPLKGAGELGYTLRRIVNSDPSRIKEIKKLLKKHKKLIVFYNFDYELDILRTLGDDLDIPVSEYNGHLHEPVPEGQSWIYLAQYLSAGEAWNCITTNAVVLYSRNYSYKQTIQAMGRIDRKNTPFYNLFYFFISSKADIDIGIAKAYSKKKNFNEYNFLSREKHTI